MVERFSLLVLVSLLEVCYYFLKLYLSIWDDIHFGLKFSVYAFSLPVGGFGQPI
jgi:hypothetical protein